MPTDCATRARKLNKEHGERVKTKKAICIIKEEREFLPKGRKISKSGVKCY